MKQFKGSTQTYQSSQQVLKIRLRLKNSIVATKWLTSMCFHDDESINSLHHRNFIELIKLLATMNDEINKIMLENTPKNAQYITPKFKRSYGILLVINYNTRFERKLVILNFISKFMRTS